MDNPTKADVSDAAHILIENSPKDVRIADRVGEDVIISQMAEQHGISARKMKKQIS